MARVVFIDGPVDGRTEDAPPEDAPRIVKVAVPQWLPAPGLQRGTKLDWGEATYQLALITVEGTRVYTWTR